MQHTCGAFIGVRLSCLHLLISVEDLPNDESSNARMIYSLVGTGYEDTSCIIFEQRKVVMLTLKQ